MGTRRQAREAAVQGLYMCDALGRWDLSRVEECFAHFDVSEAARAYALALCSGTIEFIAKVDSTITCASEHWSISRMGKVDRAILRVATYELLFLEDVPPNVALNEAIEVAKRFGSTESPTFVNGVLDKVASNVRKNGRESTAPEPLGQSLVEKG